MASPKTSITCRRCCCESLRFKEGEENRRFTYSISTAVAHSPRASAMSLPSVVSTTCLPTQERCRSSLRCLLSKPRLPAHSRILEHKSLKLISRSEMEWIAVFIAVQRHRGTHFREVMGHFDSAISKKIQALGGDPRNVKGFVPISDAQDLKLQSSAMLLRLTETVVPLVLNKQWLLFEPAGPERFWISDNPVVLHNAQEFGAYGNIGFGVPGIEIYLPLAPTLALGLWCPSRARITLDALASSKRFLSRSEGLPSRPMTIGETIELEHHRERAAQAVPELDSVASALANGTAAPCTGKNIQFFNSLQVVWSERFVMSSTDDWQQAREMITKGPHLRQGPRLRFD